MAMPLRPRRILSNAIHRINRSKSPLVRRTFTATRSALRRAVNSISNLHWGWVAHLERVRWLDDKTLEISGYAFERGLPFTNEPPTFRVWLVREGATVQTRAAQQAAPSANMRLKRSVHSYANAGFRAEADLTPLLDLVPPSDRDLTWQVVVEVAGSGIVRRGPLRSRFPSGSAGHLATRSHGSLQLIPRWQEGRGLVIAVRRPVAQVTSTSVSARQVDLTVKLNGISVQSAMLVSGSGTTPLTLVASQGDTVRLSGVVPPPAIGALEERLDPEDEWTTVTSHEALSASPEGAGPLIACGWHQLAVTDSSGARHLASCSIDSDPPHPHPGDSLYPFAGPDGRFGLRDTSASMIVDTVAVSGDEAPYLDVRGVAVGELSGCWLALMGARQTLSADQFTLEDGRFQARIPLLASAWEQPLLPPRSGGYVLRGRANDGRWFRISTTHAVVAQCPATVALAGFHLRTEIAPGRRLRVAVLPPRRDDELGPYNRYRLGEEYRATKFQPQRSVYFESFYGRAATCNPRALDAEVARRFPDWIRYWGVVDKSVAVPPGAVAVVEGTKEWWDARGRSTVVIVNDWIRNDFKHQPHQVVLQTWHGSMLKKIGLDRPTTSAMSRRALLRERERWDLLLSQNRHSTEIFRSAYDWSRPILEEGYPRNDAMTNGDGASIRTRLGIRPDQVAILYAPTWRDNVSGLVTHLDAAQFAADLGDRYLVLVRGHSRTAGVGGSVTSEGVLDVTTYPDVTELFLAADIMITDYSSVMFDYSVTGKPMIFFVPDIDDYRDVVRGVYFDLPSVAPGPVVYTQSEVTRAVQRADTDAVEYEARYAQWRARFNQLDDGHSAERVVERLFASRQARALLGNEV